jgi:hypothetical protein
MEKRREEEKNSRGDDEIEIETDIWRDRERKKQEEGEKNIL